jgi:UDP-galactose transporter B1
MNVWALVYGGAAAIVSGQFEEGLVFIVEYPAIMPPILFLSLCSALGQCFIFMTISNFNALVCTTVTTTRKFFTVLASVYYYGHSLGVMQWGGATMVFVGLAVELRTKYTRSKAIEVSMKQ